MYYDEIRRRILNTFCHLNLIMLQTILTKQITKLIKKAKRKMRTNNKQFVEIVIYEYFDFMKKQREKKLTIFEK